MATSNKHNDDRLIDDLLIAIVFYEGDDNVINIVVNLLEICKSILLINNGSHGHSKEIIEKIRSDKNVKVIDNEHNKGIGVALNQALKYAVLLNKSYMMTLDQDSNISKECVLKLIKRINHSDFASVGPFYLKEKSKDKVVKYLITSGNIVRTDIAKKVGGYDERLFIDCVDIDFSFNLLANGYKMLQVGGAYMEHRIGERQCDSPIGVKYYGHGEKRYYYNYRNNFFLYRKYFKKLPLSCLKLFVSLCIRFLKILFIEGNKRNKIHAAICGIRDGIKE